jgi:hypothetical protein
VKRKIVFVLLAAYLIGSTEFHQVLRLPLLVEHYTEHRTLVGGDMTFWEFLVMHYETDVPHDDTDMKLPFKDCHHSSAISFTALTSQKITLTLPSLVLTQPLHFYNHASFHSSYLDEIFQPPRI